jgi:hypothetical protein
MNQFRTIVSPKFSEHKIGLKNGVFTIGSCFADAIGARLADAKLNVLPNPFGTIYNPISIHKGILSAMAKQLPPESSYLIRGDINLNYDFHSDFSAMEKPLLTESLHNVITTSHNFLKSAEHILITYGTSWVYSRTDSGEIVNNCHKMPSQQFKKSLLPEHEIVDSFRLLHTAAKRFNPEIKFILTVSPVRHIKDSLELNSVSKSILRTACHTITSTYENVEYFPAYEIMMDDLRDYRFYKSDMLHPTVQAEDYIWEQFIRVYFDNPAIELIKEWSEIQSALRHRPFHPTSESHQRFLKTTLSKLMSLKEKINVDAEIAAIESQIIDL